MANDVEPLCILTRFDSKATLDRAEFKRMPQSSSIFLYNPFSFDDPDANVPIHRTLGTSQSASNDDEFFIEEIQSYPLLPNSLLPRYHSDIRNENRSADIALKSAHQTKVTFAESQGKKAHPIRTTSTFDIKYLERAYDRSGKTCRPAINDNIGSFDLEYAYEIIGDMMESYIRYRKLNRCNALSSFVEYRNKVYKREKIAQYASPTDKTRVKERTKPQNQIKLDETQSTMTKTDLASTLTPSASASSWPQPSSSSITVGSKGTTSRSIIAKSPISVDSSAQKTPVSSKPVTLLPNKQSSPQNSPLKNRTNGLVKTTSLPHTKSTPTDKGLSRQKSSKTTAKSKAKIHSKNRNQTVRSSSIMSISKSSTKNKCITCTLL